ncbi:hypothetical protein OK016_10905 [Vibrio chagasii]|nr:hypothetical protein [Vibrio chagasii]
MFKTRENNDAQGKSWLFFGDRTFTQDFLYQVEWQKYLKSGALTKLDVAFSRDQRESVCARPLNRAGRASMAMATRRCVLLCVCGDATRMAKRRT